ncbi:hypothetical protein QBC38DRAFT_515407 [Podospora fimiseda]|uniref:Uncharacterized protein n=1 Tax=Podospora fimiseda TaxID=252190 RepID=A0AAN7BJ59_9PEZI|nr:hypothetical protein QBC38DRAFT_515407 [Podospora fimiseda]
MQAQTEAILGCRVCRHKTATPCPSAKPAAPVAQKSFAQDTKASLARRVSQPASPVFAPKRLPVPRERQSLATPTYLQETQSSLARQRSTGCQNSADARNYDETPTTVSSQDTLDRTMYLPVNPDWHEDNDSGYTSSSTSAQDKVYHVIPYSTDIPVCNYDLDELSSLHSHLIPRRLLRAYIPADIRINLCHKGHSIAMAAVWNTSRCVQKHYPDGPISIGTGVDDLISGLSSTCVGECTLFGSRLRDLASLRNHICDPRPNSRLRRSGTTRFVVETKEVIITRSLPFAPEEEELKKGHRLYFQDIMALYPLPWNDDLKEMDRYPR